MSSAGGDNVDVLIGSQARQEEVFTCSRWLWADVCFPVTRLNLVLFRRRTETRLFPANSGPDELVALELYEAYFSGSHHGRKSDGMEAVDGWVR